MWWAPIIPILRVLSLRVGSLRQKGCAVTDTNIVPCTPSLMALLVESQLKRARLLPLGATLTTKVYGVARNVAAEVGAAKESTPAEKVAIAEAAWNRARLEGKDVLAMLLKDGKWFGRQRGRNPPVATTEDPTIEEIFTAQIVSRGMTNDFARGATHYFDPYTQDDKHATDPENYPKDALQVYDSWTQEDGMAWVGPLPGINPRRLFLFKKYGRGYVRTQDWKDRYEAGRAVILKQVSGMSGAPIGFAPGFAQARDPLSIFQAAFAPTNSGKTFFWIAAGVAVAGTAIALALRDAR